MSIKSDRWIRRMAREHAMIEPFEDRQVRRTDEHGRQVISYGVSSYGYDMRPNTKLTPKQLKRFFTPWHYAGVRMAWEGRWVSIQPVGS